MAEDRSFRIAGRRAQTAVCRNMEWDGGTGFARKNTDKPGSIIMGPIDGGELDAAWGRFFMEAQRGEGVVCTVCAAAWNESRIRQEDVPDFMARSEEVKRINAENILLYALKGRYLWIYIEVQGRGAFLCKNMRVDAVGDNFMAAFPEVYQERNSFFHRYLSVFSSVYNDFSRKIRNIDKLFDPDTAPTGMLEIYAGWLGIDLRGGFLSDGKMRLLVKELFGLVKKKGTKEAMERAAEIVLGAKPIIIERNLMQDPQEGCNKKLMDRLYGNSPYDICLLVLTEISERGRARLSYLLEQFKPVRCRLNIVFLKDTGNMDDYTYLGINSGLKDSETGTLDGRTGLDGRIVLK